MDPNGITQLFAEDATFAMGNGEPAVGRPAILAGSTEFLANIKGLRHTIRSEWTVDDVTIAVADATYTRHDGKEVTIPTASIWHVDGDGLITDYRIYSDPAPLFA